MHVLTVYNSSSSKVVSCVFHHNNNLSYLVPPLLKIPMASCTLHELQCFLSPALLSDLLLPHSLPLPPCWDNSGFLLVFHQARLFPTPGPLHILFPLGRRLSSPFMISSPSVFSVNLNATERPSPTLLPQWDPLSLPSTIILCHNPVVVSFTIPPLGLCVPPYRE